MTGIAVPRSLALAVQQEARIVTLVRAANNVRYSPIELIYIRSNWNEFAVDRRSRILAEKPVESPRVCRRLQPLRNWSHGKSKAVLGGGAGAGGSAGRRARARV